jgi:hypothetical protein
MEEFKTMSDETTNVVVDTIAETGSGEATAERYTSKKLITLGVMQQYEDRKAEELATALEGVDKKIDEVQTAVDNLNLDEDGVKLASDWYTYTNIGKITGASATNPKLVGEKNDSLSTVFTNLFGKQVDVDPTVASSGVKLEVSEGTIKYEGLEYGKEIGAVNDLVVTYTAKNSATTNFGCKYINEEGVEVRDKAVTTFYYPITKVKTGVYDEESGKELEADLVIKLPTGKTAEVDSASVLVTSVTDEDENTTLYCDFNSSKQVKIKIDLPKTYSELDKITRYGEIKAETTFGTPIKENQLTATDDTTDLTALATFRGESFDLPVIGKKEGTAGEYYVTAGKRYNYVLNTNSATAPTTSTGYKKAGDGLTKVNLATTADSYLWFITTTNSYSTIQQWAAQQWNNVPTAAAEEIQFTSATGETTTYYAYRTSQLTAQAATDYQII